jgi:squalene-hopene cyclase-like protein
VFEQVLKLFDPRRDDRKLTALAREARRRDREGLPQHDPGSDAVIEEGIVWLGRAQDCSASADGGVARDYSLLNGWSTSYPETTGYIVPTVLDFARSRGDRGARDRARRMLDWLVSIQLQGGGFQGGRIEATPVVPVTFNTGQILLGLAAGEQEFGGYREAMHRAADWLVATQDPDGCWRKHPTPFAEPGEKVYETHVAWGLFEAERVAPGRGYGNAGLRNVRWALTRQRENGWFSDNCLLDPIRPLTHTIGYALRGVIEAHRLSGEPVFLEAARRTADALLGAIGPDGRLAGRLDASWEPSAPYVCLTGSVQIAHCLLMLYLVTGNVAYRDKAYALNAYVRRTIDVTGAPETRGGVKGSFPVDGSYGRYEYLNWAVKFTIDANVLERDVRARDAAPVKPSASRA